MCVCRRRGGVQGEGLAVRKHDEGVCVMGGGVQGEGLAVEHAGPVTPRDVSEFDKREHFRLVKTHPCLSLQYME